MFSSKEQFPNIYKERCHKLNDSLILTILFPNIVTVYIITQVILAFRVVLVYDLLEDRRTINAIITKFFPLCFKMALRLKNLYHILHDWAKEKIRKKFCLCSKQVREAGRRKKPVSYLGNDSEKILGQSQSAVWRD